ncbi:MAG: DUF2169 domain-containing protein [Polyangiaceae bacterium]
MKVTKPMKLGVLMRPFEQKRRVDLHVAALLGFRLGAPRSLLDEMGLWAAATTELGTAVLDEGLSKPRGELLVAGRCIPLRGEPTTASYVRVQAGPLEKVLAVIGDRHWRDGAQTAPQPFVEMPIDWQHAFGGPEYPLNPWGKGLVAREDGVVPLPNVELREQMVRSPRDRPRPGALGALDASFVARRSLAGTFGADYVEKWAPGLPPDHSPTFFQLAPEDQRIQGFWSGSEPFVIENMTAGEPRVSGSLPGLTARAFAAQRVQGEVLFQEIGLVCDTVWFFPTPGIGVLIFRGRLAVADDDAADVEHLVLACEEVGRPRPIDHYEAARLRRLDKDKSAIAELSDSDLMPDKTSGVVANVSLGEMGLWMKSEGLGRANGERGKRRARETARQKIIELGQDPASFDQSFEAEVAPPELPDLDDLDAVAAFVSAQDDRARELRKEQENFEEELATRLKKAAEATGKDPSQLTAEPPEFSPGPFEFTAESVLKPMRDMVAEARASGVSSAEIEAQMNDPKFLAQLIEQENAALAMYRSSTHLGPPAAPMTDEAALIARGVIQAAQDASVSLAHRDFTGADLRGLVLAGQDFRGAFLASADLRDADLTGADLSGAVLAHANLKGASLRNAKLSGSNLGSSNLEGAVLEGADLSDAVLMRARVEGASFVGANLAGADMMNVVWKGVDLRGAQLPQASFIDADFSHANLAGARLVQATFVSCTFDHADFTEANLQKATFVTSSGKSVRFTRARCEESVFAHKDAFPEADFTDAVLEPCCLRTTNFRNGRFDRARMSMADLSECDLSSASFDQADMKRALLVRANLDGASLRGANLLEAIVTKASLRGADFTGTQLTRADFTRSKGDAGTTFAEAVVKWTRFHEEEGR